ncbi:MAG: M56 family metallopeptidase [Bacteroidales bacterium]|nr:M56 family metallopeptidase [Bacteroidales bacterium]MDD4602499.1 M56 family metallopeptidase [Bacteroidales bacterium]
MNVLLYYLMQSAFCLTTLFFIYWIFLRRDTFFQMNRLFLIFAGILSLLIPLFPFHRVMQEPVSALVTILEPVLITPDKMEERVISHFQWFEIAWIIYFTGVVVLLIRFLVQTLQLLLLVHRSGIKRINDNKVVLVDHGYSPFSFFNMIFINETNIVPENLETILAHEQVHIRQAHTFDLILGNMLIIIQWFNPFAWLIQRELKNIHEFLADEGVIREGISSPDYQQLILNETMGIRVNNLSNNFNISQIKKRITMMTKSRSGNWAIGKILLAIPAVIVTGMLFGASTSPKLSVPEKIYLTAGSQQSKEVPAQDTKKKKYPIPEIQPSFPDGEEARIKFFQENIKYPDEAIRNNIQGTVFVSFNVETDGSITGVELLRGIGGGCNEEAMRVVKLMPKWEPAELQGKPVVVKFGLPIKFKLDAGKKKEQNNQKGKK